MSKRIAAAQFGPAWASENWAAPTQLRVAIDHQQLTSALHRAAARCKPSPSTPWAFVSPCASSCLVWPCSLAGRNHTAPDIELYSALSRFGQVGLGGHALQGPVLPLGEGVPNSLLPEEMKLPPAVRR